MAKKIAWFHEWIIVCSFSTIAQSDIRLLYFFKCHFTIKWMKYSQQLSNISQIFFPPDISSKNKFLFSIYRSVICNSIFSSKKAAITFSLLAFGIQSIKISVRCTLPFSKIIFVFAWMCLSWIKTWQLYSMYMSMLYVLITGYNLYHKIPYFLQF